MYKFEIQTDEVMYRGEGRISVYETNRATS